MTFEDYRNESWAGSYYPRERVPFLQALIGEHHPELMLERISGFYKYNMFRTDLGPTMSIYFTDDLAIGGADLEVSMGGNADKTTEDLKQLIACREILEERGYFGEYATFPKKRHQVMSVKCEYRHFRIQSKKDLVKILKDFNLKKEDVEEK